MIASRTGSLEALRPADGYAGLGPTFVERRAPTPLPEPYLVAVNGDAAGLVGLDSSELERPEFLALAAGCARFAGVEPFAAVYAGHQFGAFVPQLGDGRAIALAEIVSPNGERYEWQLKGAGITAFSRFGDGRAVLRSTIREYLCSEAMAALGVPTTRALAIAGSPATVYRETPETAAVLTRIAPSHLRFGTFEYFHYRGRPAEVQTLADYAIDRFFPAVAPLAGGQGRYAAFLREVVTRTADLVARWQSVGFAHGVMNTDNMSILGLTLDYGPFGFLDTFEPALICNHTDAGGRYAFDRQPSVARWNCAALAAALSTLVDEGSAHEALAAFEPAFQERLTAATYARFGLVERRSGDDTLFADQHALLERGRADLTNAFRALSSLGQRVGDGDEALVATFADGDAARAFAARYRDRLAFERRSDEERRAAMRSANPAVVLRNYLAENAIRAAHAGDFEEVARLHAALRAPFDPELDASPYAALPPAWAARLSVSCSS